MRESRIIQGSLHSGNSAWKASGGGTYCVVQLAYQWCPNGYTKCVLLSTLSIYQTVGFGDERSWWWRGCWAKSVGCANCTVDSVFLCWWMVCLQRLHYSSWPDFSNPDLVGFRNTTLVIFLISQMWSLTYFLRFKTFIWSFHVYTSKFLRKDQQNHQLSHTTQALAHSVSGFIAYQGIKYKAWLLNIRHLLHTCQFLLLIG